MKNSKGNASFFILQRLFMDQRVSIDSCLHSDIYYLFITDYQLRHRIRHEILLKAREMFIEQEEMLHEGL